MTTENQFGPLVHPYRVEQAIVASFREWFNEYLAEIERKEGLRNKTIPRPPTPESFHGGLDATGWQAPELPKIIVQVQPEGGPERDISVGYDQAYRVIVTAVVLANGGSEAFSEGNVEDEARQLASLYGAASMLLTQQTGLGGLSLDVILTGTPALSFPNPDERSIVKADTEFRVHVGPVIEQNKGPRTPAGNEGEYAVLPEVSKTNVTLKPELIP